MALDQQLLEILACPDTHHAPLDHDAGAQTLTCTECGRIFEIRDDIPILLLDEAREPGPAATQSAGTEPASAVASPPAGATGGEPGEKLVVPVPGGGEPEEKPVASGPGSADEEGK